MLNVWDTCTLIKYHPTLSYPDEVRSGRVCLIFKTALHVLYYRVEISLFQR